MADSPDDVVAADSEPLVAAMLTPPRSATTIVSRPRVLELLDTAARGPLTIVSGEAAAGKTSVVVDWLNSAATSRPVAWLTLPRGLLDPILFWRYALAAIATTWNWHSRTTSCPTSGG
jgi:LuxR family maltose regulon positive regulatory protein